MSIAAMMAHVARKRAKNGNFVSAAIDATGLELELTYDGNVYAPETLTILTQAGHMSATYASGSGTSAVVYDLSRPAYVGEEVLVSGSSFSLARADNDSAEADPDSSFLLTKHGAITGDTAYNYFGKLADVRNETNSPWRVAHVCSTDHGAGGIWLRGAYGGDDADPTTWTWEDYDTALGRGEFTSGNFPGRPAANPIYDDGSETEVPALIKIGTDWYLTYSDETGGVDGYWGTDPSPAKLAIAEDFPLVFVLFSNGNDGKVIDWESSDKRQWPTNSHGTYLKWGPNPFPGVAYTYVGYGLMHGNGGHEFQAGSNNGTDWTIIAQLDKFLVPGLADYEVGNPFRANPAVDPLFVHDAGGGEWVTVVSVAPSTIGGISTPVYSYELWLADDGVTVTRQPRLYAGPGGIGEIDEYNLGVFAYLEYQTGRWMTVYRAVDASDDRRLALGTIDLRLAASRPAPITRPPHDVWRYEALGSEPLPAWLTDESDNPAFTTASPAGYLTYTAQGMRMSGRGFSGTAGFRSTAAYTPSSVGFLEIYVEHGFVIEDTPAYTLRLQMTDTGPDQGANGVYMVANSGTGDVPRLATRDAASTIATKDVALHMLTNTNQRGKRHMFGLRWDVAGDELAWLAGRGHSRRDILDASGAEADTPVYLRYSLDSDESLVSIMPIELVVLRVGNPTGNAIPVATVSTADSRTLTMALDRDCIGIGTGLTVDVGGIPVPGVWIREAADEYTFIRSEGLFSDSDTITLDIASTDLRSRADLVALQDATGVAVTNTL